MKTPAELSNVQLLPLTRAIRAAKVGESFVSFYEQRNIYTQATRLGAKCHLTGCLIVVPGKVPTIRRACLVLVKKSPPPAASVGRKSKQQVTITIQGAPRTRRQTLRAVKVALARIKPASDKT